MAAASMLQNASQQKEQRNANANAMDANAAQMQYSPWTGMKANMMGPQATGGAGATLGAGVNGALMGAMFNQSNAEDPAKKKPSIWSGMKGNLNQSSNFQMPTMGSGY